MAGNEVFQCKLMQWNTKLNMLIYFNQFLIFYINWLKSVHSEGELTQTIGKQKTSQYILKSIDQ